MCVCVCKFYVFMFHPSQPGWWSGWLFLCPHLCAPVLDQLQPQHEALPPHVTNQLMLGLKGMQPGQQVVTNLHGNTHK